MPEFIRNEECPKCRANGRDRGRNNLGVYSDGHQWCWSCGYLSNPLSNRISSVTQQHTVLNKEPVKLPRDISIDYPSKVLDWFSFYDLTIDDLYNHNFLWSEYFQRLIYPVWQDEQCVFWTGRYFGEENFPKWRNCGSPKDVIHLINGNANRIVIVEDIISGIKILKACNDLGVLVLFNSHNPVSKLLKISKNKKYILWLDNDKFRDSIFFSKESVGHGLDIKTVCSDRDPKDESFSSIKRILNANNH